MASNPNHNPQVFYISDPDERDQCQFVYPARNGELPTRCQHDGIYRIGEVIFLCGRHMPGVGRHPATKPIDSKKLKTRKPEEGNDQRLLKFFQENKGQTIVYDQFWEKFPKLTGRSYLSIMVWRLRNLHRAHIINVQHVGYRYLGQIGE